MADSGYGHTGDSICPIIGAEVVFLSVIGVLACNACPGRVTHLFDCGVRGAYTTLSCSVLLCALGTISEPEQYQK